MIEFFYDCSSPWTYLGFESIEKLGAARTFDDAEQPAGRAGRAAARRVDELGDTV